MINVFAPISFSSFDVDKLALVFGRSIDMTMILFSLFDFLACSVVGVFWGTFHGAIKMIPIQFKAESLAKNFH
jgi:hypothetical protein